MAPVVSDHRLRRTCEHALCRLRHSTQPVRGPSSAIASGDSAEVLVAELDGIATAPPSVRRTAMPMGMLSTASIEASARLSTRSTADSRCRKPARTATKAEATPTRFAASRSTTTARDDGTWKAHPKAARAISRAASKSLVCRMLRGSGLRGAASTPFPSGARSTSRRRPGGASPGVLRANGGSR